MKKGLFVLMMLSFCANGIAQDEVFSFYFHENGIFTLKSVQTVNPRLYARYELEDTPKNEIRRAAGEYLVVDESGIYLEKNKLLTISREEVRENSKYAVRKGWLHGVIENDSIPCALDDELYYFLIPAKTYLYGGRSGPEKLVPITGSRYAIFTQEANGFFSGIIVNFSQNGVSLNDIVFSNSEPNNIEKIENKEVKEGAHDDFTTYILNPSKDEWENFVFKLCYQSYDSYSMVINE